MSSFEDYCNTVKVPLLERRILELQDALASILDLTQECRMCDCLLEVRRIAEETYFEED
jgi:hypothetical protein